MKIGDKIQDFEVDAFFNDDIQKIKISDYKGKWLVFIFYPADFTFVCPTELEDVASLYEDFKKNGAEVFAVSTDTAFVHKAWHNTSEAIKKVKYPMLADPTGKMSKAFGTYIEEEGLSLRGSFVVDPDGIVRTIEIHDNNIGRSASELLRKLQAAKFVREHKGNVCPARWEPGKDAMKPSTDLIGKI